jgi:uncharacterized protein (DUF983 family)
MKGQYAHRARHVYAPLKANFMSLDCHESTNSQPRRSLAAALVRLRCPRCREGRLFRGTFRMNDPCPVCGLVFEREPGYFLGALYVSYGLAVACLLPVFFFLWWLLPDAPVLVLPLLSLVLYLPLIPPVVRYSRTIWLYLDRWSSPGEFSSPQAWTDWKAHQPADCKSIES